MRTQSGLDTPFCAGDVTPRHAALAWQVARVCEAQPSRPLRDSCVPPNPCVMRNRTMKPQGSWENTAGAWQSSTLSVTPKKKELEYNSSRVLFMVNC